MLIHSLAKGKLAAGLFGSIGAASVLGEALAWGRRTPRVTPSSSLNNPTGNNTLHPQVGNNTRFLDEGSRWD